MNERQPAWRRPGQSVASRNVGQWKMPGELKAREWTITFKAVATLAGVGRPICITTSADHRGRTKATRSGAATIDGVTVPHRTADGVQAH